MALTFDAKKNFAYSVIAVAPSPAASGTSLQVAPGDGAKFPTPPFNAVVWPTGVQPTTANAEVIRVTAIATDTLTITRAQESSSARTIVLNDQIAQNITRKSLTDIEGAFVTAGQILCPVGSIIMWGTVTAPTGWLLLDGTAVSRAGWPELFSLWGTTYGIGDGSTTFGIPDMRQRVPIGVATSGTVSTLGATTGSFDHTHGPGTLTVAAHTHGPGTLTVASHQHGPGSLTVASHSHGPGTLATNSALTTHTHAMSNHTHSMQNHFHAFAANTTNNSATRTVDNNLDGSTAIVAADPHLHGVPSTATGGPSSASTGTPSDNNTGTANLAHTHSVTTGTTATTAPSVNAGVTDLTAPTVNAGVTASTTPAVSTGVSAAANPPYLALNFIVRAESGI